ncbi:MAG: N-acetylmannosamine-6-phosphate 2-epimerase [Mobilicoccus sp.]|nr:N-acetylmannosamine-6-phosphate 2-epimerase [Mobilicoccus sp.]
MTAHDQLLSRLRGRLIVSCQAYPGEPMRSPDTMRRVAQAVEIGGAAAVRAQGIDDITAVSAALEVPVVGIWKDGEAGVFITPTLEHALAVARAGADIVALDGTLRERPDGLDLAETLRRLRAEVDVPVMADCDSLEAGIAAAEAGADLIGTTLAGYTDARPKTHGPDLQLVEDLVAALPESAVVAEGRIHSPADARRALEAGAHSVVVGTAITHPTTITRWFVDAL